ncbi:MAG: hypothetical protein JHD28_01630 [Bacteroidia bacterium]|nr:hypothetical protein [Bacteroidia bacterium]
MKHKIGIVFSLLCIIQSCCKDTSNASPFGSGFKLVVQSKDGNNVYKTVRINTIEWLGSEHLQQVNSDTSGELTLNNKANITQFKINHDNGIDTLTFRYNWGAVSYEGGCYGSSGRMERKLNGLTFSMTNGTVQSGFLYILRRN